MLDEIGSKDRVPAYIESIKAGKGKLMGFGHRDLQELRSARPHHQANGRSGV